MSSIRKEKPKTFKENYRKALRELRVVIWSCVKIIPAIWDMSDKDFPVYFSEGIKEVGKIKNRSAEAIEKYTRRGVPEDITFEIFSEHIEAIFEDYMRSDGLSFSQKEHAKEQWKHHKGWAMKAIRTLFEALEEQKQIVKGLAPFFEDDFWYFCALQCFIGGKCLSKGPCTDENEIEFLRSALKRYPPSYKKRKRNNSKR